MTNIARKAWFTSTEQPALEDFWRIYQENHARIAEASEAALSDHPVFGPMLRNIPREQLDRQSRESNKRMEMAVQGDWEPYESNLRQQGIMYAQQGVGVDVWYDVINQFSRHLTPCVVRELNQDAPRLVACLLVTQKMLDRAMSIVAQQYLATKEQMIEQQKLLAEERASALAVSDRELRRQTTILTSVLENVREGVSVCDEAGRIILFNKSAREICGAEGTGQSVTNLSGAVRSVRVNPAKDGEDIPLMLRALRGEAPDDVEIWIERQDGTRILCNSYARPLTDANGERQGAMTIFRDITERQRLEAERTRSQTLEALNVQIKEASRLKSEFLANMSHELRTPLNAIIGFAELIHDGEVTSDMPQYQEFLGDILNSGRHLLQLINDVLDLSKVEAGKLDFHPETLEPGRVVNEVVAILRATAAAQSIQMEVVVDPALGTVFVDSARLKQVLYNYLSNALKFSFSGGLVRIHVNAVDQDSFRLEVEDSGIGIAQRDVGKLFVEFQQLDSGAGKHHGGTGLGLALTRRLVEAQGGSVGVSSTKGKGSVFHAVLPRHARMGTAIPEPATFAGASGNAATILVVEDNAEDQKFLVQTLTDAGYAVDTAATSAQALEKCSLRRFDAITLDLLLPDSSGLDLLRSIRAQGNNAHVPVVVITVVAEKGTLAGFAVHDILAKPLDGPALLASLGRAGVKPTQDVPVLVVDDDPGSLRLMAATLSQLGYKSVGAPDAVAGLRAAREAPPLAVVLDLVMPNMNGFEFLDAFRRLPGCDRVPVIIWSMKDLTSAERALVRASAQAVVAKGQDPTARVLEVLRTALPVRPSV